MKFEKIICVYGIFCTKNNMVYIGQAMDFYKRIIAHKDMLDNNTHTNRNIQNDFNIYGSDYFEYNVLERCEEENLTNRENFYINKYKEQFLCYNLKPAVESPMKGKKHSDETKDRMTQNRTGKKGKKQREFSEQRREMITGTNSARYGAKHSPETIEKMKKSNKRSALGTTLSNERREFLHEVNFGKKKTKGTSQYIGVSWHGASNKWRSRFYFNGKDHYLGIFENEIDAAIAYDNAIFEIFEFKYPLNFPENYTK